MNKAMITGRLGQDPRLTDLPSGTRVANFNIATDESYKNKDGVKVAKTEWHRVVMYSKLADVAGAYLKKGRLIQIEGKLKTREYTDKDNVKRWVTEVIAQNMTMLDKPPASIPPPEAIPAEEGAFDEAPF